MQRHETGLTQFQLETLWSSVLAALPHRKASFFVESLIAPGIFWLIGAALDGFGALISKLGLLALGFLGILASTSAVLQLIWKSRVAFRRRWTGAVVLVHQAYYSSMMLMVSLFCLILVLQLARTQGSHIDGWIVAVYVMCLAAGAFWAPRSFPKGPNELRQAAEREVKWFPWAIVVPEALALLCALLGGLVSGDFSVDSFFVAVGLTSIVAMALASFGVLGLYRFYVLAVSHARGFPTR